MSYKLESHLSHRVARTNPLEMSPANLAALEGRPNIADTWGGYATRIMEYHDLEPAEAVAALGISKEQLSDPTLLFTTANAYRAFKNTRIDNYMQKAFLDLSVEVNRLRDIVDEVMSGYEVDLITSDDPAVIQDLIDQKSTETKVDQERAAVEHEIDVLCMKRDALNSGVYIHIDEFVSIMLSTNVLSEDAPSELWQVWIQALDDAVEYFWRDYCKTDLPISEMIGGRDLFITFKSFLSDTHKAAKQIADEKWAYIEPAFIAPKFADLPLIAGNER